MRTMVPPCETPASPTDDLTRTCVHDKASQLFLDEQKNRYNSATFQWGAKDGLGNTEAQDSKDIKSVSLINTDVADVIEKLKTLSCSEKECSRSRDCGDGRRTDLLVSSKMAAPINSKSMPNLISEKTANNNNIKKGEENNMKSSPSQNIETKAPNKRVRATHRRNLSLDFRAMGIELPPLSEVAPSVSPPRILHNIPESPVPASHEATHSPAPAITPKIKHVVRRILNRRISRIE